MPFLNDFSLNDSGLTSCSTLFHTFHFGAELVFRMFNNCTEMAVNAVRSFSQDGKMKHSEKEPTATRLLIYSLTSLLNNDMVFPTQIKRGFMLMNQLVVSMIQDLALCQYYSKGPLSMRQIWPVHSQP